MTLIINETRALQEIREFFVECDVDELSRLLGEIFGGEVTPKMEADENGVDEWIYYFEPNEDYSGAFWDVPEVNEN